ncbi:pentapeptide repeat-containing protein [Streptomyces sp. NPDC018019]|uniref:pentapeptide repeat-containing protein n=1 Tax=Streptomyces sp. NPDC018019 TaxID=3365030 RepID=UPI0037AA7C7F
MTHPMFDPLLNWQHCGHGADTPADPDGCRGIPVPGHTACLAHLADTDRTGYLDTLRPGADIDHRGTPFTKHLLEQLLSALHDPTIRRARLGTAWFHGAAFHEAWFGHVSFSGDALFTGASFSGTAHFNGASFSSDASFTLASFSAAFFVVASFSGRAWFDSARFSDYAEFHRASFSRTAEFSAASFSGSARFHEATFAGGAEFNVTTFSGAARFDKASFSGTAQFEGARFEVAPRLGPLVCAADVRLDGAVFGAPVTLEISAPTVTCVRTQWESAATLRLRYAEVDLSDAVFEHPVTVTAHTTPFPTFRDDSQPEPELPDRGPGVRLTCVRGVDAAYLALHDIDLSACRFAGAIHLDQLRVDGWCTFGSTPAATVWYRNLPRRWSLRRTLVEEHHWRARSNDRPSQLRGWSSPAGDDPDLQPAALAALYRQLRKSLEDGKNEPDAADFYYGEMEMRRHDSTRPTAERALLAAYWALSGYGLRAARTLTWLLAAMTVTLLALMLWGLPTDNPQPKITGRQTGSEITLTTNTPDPRNPTGAWDERVTTERFEKALRVVINSVVFRSSGQDLTTAGTYTEMASRIAEPVLLGLAVLAIRNRVKR